MAVAAFLPSLVFARPLGGLEQFFSLVDQHRSVHFAMAAHIEGHTTIAAWRTALDALQERHPFFSVGIDRGDGGSPYFRPDVNARIPLRVVANPEHANWQMEVAKELAAPFDEQQAPLVRAVLSHGTNESIFILTAHHSIADGLSLAYAIRDALRVLSGKALEPLPPTLPQELLVELSLQQASGTQRPVESVPAERGMPVAFRPLYGVLPSIDALRLTPELTSRLLELSRKEETTVHGALCAALALAGREVSSDWRNAPVRILSPFNLRKQIGIGEDCGLFVWAGVIPIEPHIRAGFWDIARFARSSLTSQQSLEHVAIGMKTLSDAMPPGIDTYGASQILAQAFPCELLLTNLGKLSCEFDCGDLKLRALWGPAVFMGFEGEQTVGVTTTNGSLCLLHSSFTPLPWLLPRTERILRLVCEGEPIEQALLRKMPLMMIECGDRCRIQG
jgi:hypothetical protein